MQPTFKTGDLVFVDRRAYRETDPRRGDVVVIPYRNELVIKRIVGLPGEELELKGGLLYVNGLPLQENHSGTSGDLDIGKGKLFPGKFATLGDNRNTTPLLAVHPIVTKEQIVGKVIWSIKLPRGQVRNSNPPS